MRAFSTLVAWTSFMMAIVLSPRADAATWRPVNNLIPASTLERLAERYPNIRDANELENLLLDIGRRQQMLRLEARFENGIWVVDGTPAILISDLDVRVTARMMTQLVYASLQNYIGQVDSPESRVKVVDVVQRYMYRHGYPWSNTNLKTSQNDEGTVYDIAVDEGTPCVLDRIDIAFKLPLGTKLDIRPGDSCDLELIDTALS